MTEAEKAPGKSSAAKTALCLLAVLLVGGAVAAVISISLSRSRRNTADSMRAHLEFNSVGSMRAYAEAQTMFHRNDWDADGVLDYATPYALLNTCADGSGNPVGIIDTAFAGAQGPNGAPKHGYLFQDMKTIGGKSINWVDDYALCGTPARYGKTGYRTFIVRTDGTVWGKDLGESKFLKDFPADPAAEGWVIAE